MAPFDLPCAISRNTSSSRGLRRLIGESATRVDAHRRRQARGLRLDGLQQATIAQQRWMNAMCQLAQVFQGLADVRLQLRQRSRGQAGIARQLIARQPRLGQQRHQFLLHTVMNVALDAPTAGLLRLHDPRP
jgi:hypothetical protein